MTHTMRLPRDWVEAPFGDVIVLQKGNKPAHVFEEPNETTLPYIDIKAFERGKVTKHATPEGAVPVEEGTILLVWDGARSGLAGCSRVQGLLGSTLMRVEPVFVDKAYALYFLQQSYRELNTRTRGTGIPHVDPQVFSGLAFPLAPTHEQHRIVEAIESYLTRLDDAVASLKRVQRNLDRYRASVLKAAVEGRLIPTEVELARKEGRDYEPASELLKRIIVERCKKWIEDATEKGRAKAEKKARETGKPWTHTDDVKTLEKQRAKADKKYKEPTAPDTTDLPDLPEGWCWATVEQLVWAASYGTSQKCSYDAKGPMVLRIPNIQNGNLNFIDTKRATEPGQLASVAQLDKGDFLFIRTNGSKSLIGRGALVCGEPYESTYFASYLIRLRLIDIHLLPEWFAGAWHSDLVRNQLLRDAVSSAGQHNVSLSAASRYVVPLPPSGEAARILAEIERTWSIADASREAAASATGKALILRQSILKWAFEGKLVEQDPNAEPASVLLERIKAERESMQPRKRHRTGKRKNVNAVNHDEQLNLLEGSNK